MSDTTQQDALRKSWELLNLQVDALLKIARLQGEPANTQADTLLKLAQARTEPWKMAMGGIGAGAALFASGFALAKLFLG